ncbi:Integration host factor subunit beta [Desulfovibrionales bacterium]
MNKSELIKILAEENDILIEEADTIVNVFIDTIKDFLIKGSRVEIRSFGSFKIKNYNGYVGRNPKTGDIVTVQPKQLPFFRVGKELKEYINQ